MVDQKLTNILADLVRANAARGPLPNFQQVSGLSQQILSQVGLQKPFTGEAVQHKDPRGPSVVNRVLDIMSRPLYATLTPLKHVLEQAPNQSVGETAAELAGVGNPIDRVKEVWSGLSGKEKTTGKDIVNAAGGENLPGIAKGAIGFGIDVLGDPTTYVGAGLIPKIGKAAKVSTEALRAVEEGTGKTAQNLSEEISRRAAQQATNPSVLAADVAKVDTSLENVVHAQDLTPPQGPAQKLLSDFNARQFDQAAALDPELQVAQAPAKRENLLQQFFAKQVDEAKGVTKPPAEESAFMREIKNLHETLKTTKSPIKKNVIRQQINKLEAGVTPADVLEAVRKTPAPFPEVTIGERWVEAARAAAQRYLKVSTYKEINHLGQTSLYDRIVHAASKVRKDRRAFHVLQMLRVAEDEILASGRKLVDADGISLRLSDVANMLGGPKALNPKVVEDFRKAKPSQAVEDLKAYITPQVASEILDPVIKTGADIAEAAKDLPPARTMEMGSELSRELSKIAEKAGASSREAGTAKQFINDLFNPDRDQLYSAVQQEARSLVRQSSTGIVNPKTLYKISDETYKALGQNPKILGRQMEQTKVVEGIMTKFATWWGAKDLKPFSREYIDTARNVAAAFSETIKPLVAKTTASQRKTAWGIAQGRMTAGSPEEQALADQFKYMVERLLGAHGIDKNAEAVLLRSGTVFKELNDEMPKTLKFIDGKGEDKLGRKFDYTDGNWMHSWKEWNDVEPAEALYQLTRSLQMVTRKNAMWDDAAVRWGLPTKGAEYQYEAPVARLKGTYFPEEIAKQLGNLSRQLDRDVFKTPHKSIELFDKVQRMWKTGVTIYSPSHHIRNLNGDVYLAALDGVTSVKPYTIATKVLHAFPSRYKSLESVFNIMDPNLRERALKARPGNTVLTTRRGEKLTSEQIFQAAESQGLFIRAMHVEDLLGDSAPAFGTFGTNFKPLGGKVYDAATRASELRDHWVRLAHFVDVLSKSRAPLRVAIEEAGRRVRKFHPDGMDLTGLEQNVLRRVIPFYSWMRKATPLVIEGAIMRPHITMAFPKAMANVQYATGIESEGPGDPFPMDQMFPDWIKEKGIGPILNPGSGLGREDTWRGHAPGYTIVNPSSPFLDQVQQLGAPEKTALSSLSPVARIPIELLMGQNTLGIPLENIEGGTPGYLAQQIPQVGLGMRLSGQTRDNEPYNPEQLINYLTGLGVTGTGPYQAQSQVEIQQLMDKIAKQRRGDYR